MRQKRHFSHSLIIREHFSKRQDAKENSLNIGLFSGGEIPLDALFLHQQTAVIRQRHSVSGVVQLHMHSKASMSLQRAASFKLARWFEYGVQS